MASILVPILIVVGIVVVVVLAVVLWFVRGQNNLVHAEELCGNALAQIGVQQASRWDALTTLADLAKSYSEQEYKAIMDTVGARQGIGPKSSAGEVEQQEKQLGQGIARVNALAEAYPEFRSNTLYLKTMDEVANYENKVRVSRMVYNDTVTKYNRLVRSMPGSMLAGQLGFAPREYLEADPGRESMPALS